jgi:hypothetical protein
MTEGRGLTLVLSVRTAAPPRMVSRSGIPVPGLLFAENNQIFKTQQNHIVNQGLSCTILRKNKFKAKKNRQLSSLYQLGYYSHLFSHNYLMMIFVVVFSRKFPHVSFSMVGRDPPVELLRSFLPSLSRS